MVHNSLPLHARHEYKLEAREIVSELLSYLRGGFEMKLIRVTRNDASGSYVMKLEEIDIQAEFDDLDYADVGDAVTLTVIEMTEEEHDKLEEFSGW